MDAAAAALSSALLPCFPCLSRDNAPSRRAGEPSPALTSDDNTSASRGGPRAVGHGNIVPAITDCEADDGDGGDGDDDDEGDGTTGARNNAWGRNRNAASRPGGSSRSPFRPRLLRHAARDERQHPVADDCTLPTVPPTSGFGASPVWHANVWQAPSLHAHSTPLEYVQLHPPGYPAPPPPAVIQHLHSHSHSHPNPHPSTIPHIPHPHVQTHVHAHRQVTLSPHTTTPEYLHSHSPGSIQHYDVATAAAAAVAVSNDTTAAGHPPWPPWWQSHSGVAGAPPAPWPPPQPHLSASRNDASAAIWPQYSVPIPHGTSLPSQHDSSLQQSPRMVVPFPRTHNFSAISRLNDPHQHQPPLQASRRQQQQHRYNYDQAHIPPHSSSRIQQQNTPNSPPPLTLQPPVQRQSSPSSIHNSQRSPPTLIPAAASISSLSRSMESASWADNLPSFDATGPQAEESCAICLGPLSEERVSTGQCLHLMHTSCLKQWLGRDRHGACPVCRVPYRHGSWLTSNTWRTRTSTRYSNADTGSAGTSTISNRGSHGDENGGTSSRTDEVRSPIPNGLERPMGSRMR